MAKLYRLIFALLILLTSSATGRWPPCACLGSLSCLSGGIGFNSVLLQYKTEKPLYRATDTSYIYFVIYSMISFYE